MLPNLVDEFIGLYPPVVIEMLGRVFKVLALTAPYWLPILLVFLFIRLWTMYVRAKHRAGLEWTLIEIKLPREIAKTPEAMELALQPLYQKKDGTWPKRWLEGFVRPWFSLEIASIEGRIHFFIYTQRFFAKLIETQIYSQYPEVEIFEVDDYTSGVAYKGPESDWDVFGTEFKLSKPDPLPIKTYIDYRLDREVKDDRMRTDPITPLIEFLGAAGQGEQIWIQIPVMAAKDRFSVAGSWFKKRSWKDEGEDLVKKITKSNTKTSYGEEGESNVPQILSPGKRKMVESIERGLSKFGFDCGLRAMYLAKKDVFNFTMVAGLVGIIKQYSAEDMNSFKPRGNRTTDFDYPWQDFKNMRLLKRKRDILRAYRMRSFFYPPYKRHPFVLSAEELATIYHFPGSVAETPTFDRIPSKTAEPPGNLPA